MGMSPRGGGINQDGQGGMFAGPGAGIAKIGGRPQVPLQYSGMKGPAPTIPYKSPYPSPDQVSLPGRSAFGQAAGVPGLTQNTLASGVNPPQAPRLGGTVYRDRPQPIPYSGRTIGYGGQR